LVNRFTCQMCSEEYNGMISFIQHIDQHAQQLQKDNLMLLTFACPKCACKKTDIRDFVEHMRTNHL
jgi:hypothetical protein